MIELYRILFRRIPVEILLTIKRKESSFSFNKEKITNSLVVSEIKSTYSHVSKIIKQFVKMKLLTYNSQGRGNNLRLTKRGKKVVKLLEEIKYV